MMQRLGLTARLLALGLLPSLAALLLLGALLQASMRESLHGGLAQRLGDSADRIQAHLSLGADGQWRYGDTTPSGAFNQIFSGAYWVLQAPGQTLYSRSLWDASLQPQAPAGRSGLLRNRDPRGRALLGLERRIEQDDQQATLRVYVLAEETDQALARIQRILFMGLGALFIGAALTTALQVRWGLRPLARLQQRLAGMHDAAPTGHASTADNNPAALGSGYGPDLDPLAHEIDALLERNARMLARGRAHAADLSHALKTPLARLSAQASQTPQVPSPLVLAQVHSMNGLIERHLSRTSSSGDAHAAGANRQAVPVHEVLQQLVQLMQHIRPEKSLHWQLDADRSAQALHWRGDRADLEEMLGNLLDNASKWASRRVHIQLQAAAPANAPAPPRLPLCITIADDGPGIAAEHLQHAGQRGQRFDQSTPGSGLGLSIVADIAHSWGGQLQLSPSPALGGLQAQLWLPA
ncbi:sensor histidine kinase [Vandammella animalimorsus]|uniref:histidine kinase n=1 Tax=Vandammella animalimorsus TaxID=2029117 RepID=A0A2A2AKM1_9BURK|nr:HAMP domain-containing sensor histidine kinase [Vandammella animalimorsus]PAT38278.1 histidine kinase [Vandammella animalimorsus]